MEVFKDYVRNLANWLQPAALAPVNRRRIDDGHGPDACLHA